jgi:hypothetical protein
MKIPELPDSAARSAETGNSVQWQQECEHLHHVVKQLEHERAERLVIASTICPQRSSRS